jgi:hypothetical protein
VFSIAMVFAVLHSKQWRFGALALSGAMVLVSQDKFCNFVNFAKYLGD